MRKHNDEKPLHPEGASRFFREFSDHTKTTMLNVRTDRDLITAQFPHEKTRHSWGVILAGGEGTRMKRFLKTELGQDRPKQFCSIVGTRSMLRHTIDRASGIIPSSQLLTVVSRHHLRYAMDDLFGREPKTVITQPFNRETGAGILLSIIHIQQRDPNAIVSIFPSDHFILEERRFMEHVRAAFSFVEKNRDTLVTLGAIPSNAESGYGWIESGELFGREGDIEIHRVKQFWEKPDDDVTNSLFAQGCLLNTLTMVGSVAAFIRLFKEYTPDVFSSFLPLWDAIGTPREAKATEEIFSALPSINFSYDILQHVPQCLAVLPVKEVYWNDWGDERRVRADLARIVLERQTKCMPSKNKVLSFAHQHGNLVFPQSQIVIKPLEPSIGD
jgi:mannose-1-phosphate guanylyltransferase